MIRVLIFILSVFLVAGVVTYFASLDGAMEINAFGNIYTIQHAGVVLGGFFFLFLAFAYGIAWFKDLAALPGKLKQREKEARRTRGVAALTRGLEAVMVGDAADAQHHARVAQRNLDDSALTRLLTAQAAEIAGDEKTAGENFTAMLEAPETEFLGLRGLYLKALREDDKAAAQKHAERAFKLRPNAKWAFESVFDLALERGAWGESRNMLKVALKNKIIDASQARRGEAALLTADAYAASLTGETAHALDEAEAALKIAPGFAPAATLAAELHNAKGKRQRAAKILEQAFAEEPHPGLTKAHRDLFVDLEPVKRAEQLKKIADRKPTARDAKLNIARRHIILEKYEDAIAVLEPLLMEKATAREYAAMADAVAGAHGTDAAKSWLESAANAPRDPSLGADGSFNLTRDGWARLVREYMHHGRLAPPPLEDAPRGLSLDELKLLAPPAAVEIAATEKPEADASDMGDLGGLPDEPIDVEPEPAPAASQFDRINRATGSKSAPSPEPKPQEPETAEPAATTKSDSGDAPSTEDEAPSEEEEAERLERAAEAARNVS